MSRKSDIEQLNTDLDDAEANAANAKELGKALVDLHHRATMIARENDEERIALSQFGRRLMEEGFGIEQETGT